MPSTIYRFDPTTGKSSVFSKPALSFNTDAFTCEMKFYQSKDGTRIPIFLTYKKGLKRNGHTPVLMYGYGGFNVSYQPYFSAMRIPFLESGGIYAYVVFARWW